MSKERVEKELSMEEKYNRLTARYRELGQKHFKSGLSAEELKEQERLGEMAELGLFVKGLSEVRLKSLDAEYRARFEAETQEPADPQLLAEEYRELGKRLFKQGLEPESLERYRYLGELAEEGRFESQKSAR